MKDGKTCPRCDGRGVKDYAGFAMDVCECQKLPEMELELVALRREVQQLREVRVKAAEFVRAFGTPEQAAYAKFVELTKAVNQAGIPMEATHGR
ncbi:hypothetical protein EOE18_13935 [Novosphingobium umbonatum]|uniref:Uncharacterized protein n=1 Tax=Novosphingobium umbonatum TaxID=1908524 RepID=A0A3S2UQY5_9SPHN|nr:hypothetical protein [Novosphingobium umbonatum]RVU03949.1 hypothetical protein EOE18_13935 [Novosphingobium umbonatum]